MSYRAGFVGLIGLPNSGKSTLMNALVGEKVSIVTAKPQTTRRRVLGVVSEKELQAIFVDAPGIVTARAGLHTYLREEALDVVAQSDVLIAVLNIDEPRFENLQEIIDLVRDSGKPWFAVIHKTDLPDLHRPQILRAKLEEMGVSVVQGSALHEAEDLRELVFEKISGLLPFAEQPLFSEDLYTLSSERELCAEIIREKCFLNLHQEIPFGLAVRILLFDATSGPSIKIHAEIVVGKENHRPIVIGREGRTLKQIGIDARKEMEKLVDRKIFLNLRVISKPNWARNPGFMKDLGYVVQA